MNKNQSYKSLLCGTVAMLVVALVARVQAAGREVWISPASPAVTSGAGVGDSPSNPYKCPSSYYLNQVLNSSVIPANSRIHLMPGAFTITNQIAPVAGWKLRGAGMDVTTIQLAPGLPGLGFTAIGISWGSTATDGVEVSDMTIDCNLQNQTNFNAGAVVIGGNNTKISRVRAINWGSQNGGECFVLWIVSFPWYDGPKVNSVIEDCVVDTPAPVIHNGTSSAIGMLSGIDQQYVTNWAKAVYLGGEIRGCIVSGITANSGGSGSPTSFNAYAAGRNVKIHHNRAINLLGDCNGVYEEVGDTNGYNGIVIANNVFENVFRCIQWNTLGGGSTGTKILNNVLMPAEGGWGIWYNGQANTLARDWIVKDNVIQPHASAANASALRIYGDFIRGSVLNNVFQGAGTGHDMNLNGWDPMTGFSTFAGNVNLSGTILTAYNAEGSLQTHTSYEDVIKFRVPANSNGWYRVLSGNGLSSGLVEVNSGFSDGLATDLEFSYRVRPFTSDTNIFGDLILTRQGSYYKCCGNFHGGTISKARIGSNWNGTAGTEVYLDIYVENASQAADYTLIVRGFNRMPFLVAPQRVTSTPAVVKETVFKYYDY